jgi:hypothetical protein
MLRVQLLTTAIVMAAGLYEPASADRIGNDSGGVLIEYALRVAKANERGRRIEFHGRCGSACTLYLSLPKERLCVGKGALLPFMHPMAGVQKAMPGPRRFFRQTTPIGSVHGSIATVD